MTSADASFSIWAANALQQERTRRDLEALNLAGWKTDDELMRLPWPPCCPGTRALRLATGGDELTFAEGFRCVHGCLLDAPL